MVRQKADDVKDEVNKQKDEFYGEGTISGSAPDVDSDDEVEESLKEVYGDDVSEVIKKKKDFSVADEVKSDELKRRGRE